MKFRTREVKRSFGYLKKGITKMWKRGDGEVLTIRIVNEGDKRLKIDKKYDKIFNKILKEIFFDNGEFILSKEQKHEKEFS